MDVYGQPKNLRQTTAHRMAKKAARSRCRGEWQAFRMTSSASTPSVWYLMSFFGKSTSFLLELY